MKFFKSFDMDWLLVAIALASIVIAYFIVTNSERGEKISIQQCEIIFDKLKN